MINAGVRQFHVTVGGTDLSAYHVSFEMRETYNGQGLFTQQGNMVFGQYAGSSVDLNERSNPSFWARGQVIVLSVWNDSQVLTTLKTWRILQAGFDPLTNLQTCEIGCALKLIDYPVVRDCDVKALDVRLGYAVSKTNLINSFLDYFGLPDMVGTVPDSINYPVIGESESLAALAGRLAYNSGYSLWVNQQGNVVPISNNLEV